MQNAMSALPPIADMCSATWHVRFVPIADIRRCAKNWEKAVGECNDYPMSALGGHSAGSCSARHVSGLKSTRRPKAQLPPRHTALGDRGHSQNGGHLSWVVPTRQVPSYRLTETPPYHFFGNPWAGRYVLLRKQLSQNRLAMAVVYFRLWAEAVKIWFLRNNFRC